MRFWLCTFQTLCGSGEVLELRSADIGVLPLDEDEQGNLIHKAGIMGIVLSGGEVKAGDAIHVELPPEPHFPLERV